MLRHDHKSIPLPTMLYIAPTPRQQSQFSRRDFLASSLITGAALALSGVTSSATPIASPIAVFSKIYQELKLDFDAAAEVTAQAGLDGIDCPVRDGGEILPEHAAEQLPRYAE